MYVALRRGLLEGSSTRLLKTTTLLSSSSFSSSSASGIARVAVVGSGTLGTQVSLQTALCGFEVRVLDTSPAALDKCAAVHKSLLKMYVERSNPEHPEGQARAWRGIAKPGESASQVASETLRRIRYTTSAEEALRGCDLVSENVPEIPEIKSATYQKLHEHCPSHTIFTTNSSTLLPSQFASLTGRSSQFLALHFANGIWDANIAEVMPHAGGEAPAKGAEGTDPEVVDRVLRFAEEIRMVPFTLTKEQSGYIINSLLVPWLHSSLSLVRKGVSSPRDVDRAWLISVGGFRGPPGAVKGPFQIMDIIGLPIVSHIMSYWGTQLKDEQMRANGAFVKENYVDRGKLGIMNLNPLSDEAEGFYSYPNPEFLRADFLD
ncbi:3-hydroxybutyryl-CoA dehydrogenase [Chloropicon primus]|uniref:3-hydroxybutyryl-CoA dehydrogenase n=1 Tax=Chloropicon primus TaxID=1764295 RepID=A0A5B8MSB4_9CHLO|nr:3-hydroxybutyryl-CoA dehydrogenase [Chloropicon primus]UPR02701.1 3-hydroxybutyryl-CoA dehydrogenase [Chloropicon primus]|mmetsp:Transcript_8306/g.23762  ORF Transcript_8306/g.23762 Transcript_8306/m.23762 type:complete len:376 (-) Transcript_8306:984-2111(-)|eukprot:QDZ23489.1 3-hydroxybutyryl-CoA dehydrogenase [Chloropicon primus]